MSYSDICSVWDNYNITKPEDVDTKLYDFKILFAYHSSKIENEKISYYDTREVFETDAVTGFSGEITTLFDLRNQKLCYEFLRQSIANRKPITKEFVLKVHKILLNNCYDKVRYELKGERPGSFKKGFYIVGPNEQGSAPEDVDSEIEDLLSDILSTPLIDKSKLLKAAAYFHCVFESIHPFADGNGRTGRALLNYFLMINNHPPVIVYSEDKLLYFECLEKFNLEEDIKPMVAFLEYCVERTWTRLVPTGNAKLTKSKLFNDYIQ